MKTVGIIASILVTGGVVVVAGSVVMSLSDIARYRRLRRM
jgi:hypothetical protein